MALTFTQLTPAAEFWQAGNLKFWLGKITLDSSYPTGGYSIPQTQQQIFGMLQVIGVQIVGYNAAGSLICQVAWDYANSKLMAYGPGASSGTISAPVFTGTALGNHAHDLLIKGGQAASTTNDVAMYAGPLIGKEQAADATVVGGSATNGGVQNASAGTPAGTVSAPTFTGVAGAFAQIANGVNLAAVTVIAQIVGR